MSTEPQAAEDPPEASPVAIGCAVGGLAVGTLGSLFAVSQEAGVLAVWVSGAAALYWAARRTMPDPSATPPPEGAGTDSDDTAGGGDADAEGVRRREGMSIMEDPARPGHVLVIHHYTEEPS